MSKGQKSNKEIRKPKAAKPKTNAAISSATSGKALNINIKKK
ncbi:hypothetical protein [Hirschia baltica]|uniref:Uncharacterized protein n=1 Tax=Hirschia baltica (strain ATCC 49814 / DSM 5838 / IFAM 1418) TaxID=582402 RepID=C6XQK1_HIRBI|nr:hypothetical protein [Hirschia baltica]ACT58607.1 hypothetical protein Hbal_0913 [Hirschia baltica ATCC 49814]